MILPVIHNKFFISKPVYSATTIPRLSFSGIGPEQDTFVKSILSNNEYLETTHKNIQKHLDVITPQDVSQIITRIKLQFPELTKDEILRLLNRLSAYSSYNSMNYLAGEFHNKNIRGIYDFLECFVYKTKTVTDDKPENNKNGIFKVFKSNGKKIVTLVQRSYGVPLGSVFDYLTCFKYPMNYKSPQYGLILDQNAIKLFEAYKKSDPDMFRKEFLENDNLLPIYINDFENSYNFLNQGKSFEEAALNICKKYSAVKKFANSLPEEKLLDLIFNCENLKRIKQLGFTPERINPPSQEAISEETIAKNLNPVVPDKEKFQNIITKIVGENAGLDPAIGEKLLLDYLNTNLAVYSSRTLSKKLKSLHEKIVEDVKAKGYSEENIYYTVLHPAKSFVLINYQYQKVNNIPDDKIIYWIGCANQANLDLKLPEKSTIVVLDDCFVSGNTIMYEMFNYKQEANGYCLGDQNVNLLFASVLSTNTANKRVKNNIINSGREKHDDIISVDTTNIDWPAKMKTRYLFKFFRMLRNDTHILATTAVVFPYMGSDTNAPGLRKIFALFVPNQNYLHNEVKTDDFFND